MSDAPSYARRLDLQHEAFRPELQELVEGLARALSPDRGIVDVACGDGEFTALLAAAFPGVPVTGLDASQEMLERARGRHGGTQGPRFLEADLEANDPPVPAADLVFCADSLRSLDPMGLLRRMAGWAGAGGHIAILESDPIDEIKTSASPEIEALLADLQVRSGLPDDGVARRIGEALTSLGCRELRIREDAAHRQAPFDDATEEWLERYWSHRLEGLGGVAAPEEMERLREALDPESDGYFARATGAWIVRRRVLAWAVAPG